MYQAIGQIRQASKLAIFIVGLRADNHRGRSQRKHQHPSPAQGADFVGGEQPPASFTPRP